MRHLEVPMPSRSPALLLLVALPFACATPAVRSSAPVHVDGATAKRLVAEGARLVDVRDAESYALGHIEGAINVPVTEVAARAAEIGVPGASVVVYCRTGARSAKAAGILNGMGYQRVYDLGSYLNWGEGAPAATPLPAVPGPKT
jgi:phage shock protein E